MADQSFRLRTSARPGGSEPSYRLYAMPYSVDANGFRRKPAWGGEYRTVFFDERGELRLQIPETGVYGWDVHVYVQRSDGVGSGAIVELSPKPRITVHDSRQEQLFDLSIPEAAIRAAVERAAR